MAITLPVPKPRAQILPLLGANTFGSSNLHRRSRCSFDGSPPMTPSRDWRLFLIMCAPSALETLVYVIWTCPDANDIWKSCNLDHIRPSLYNGQKSKPKKFQILRRPRLVLVELSQPSPRRTKGDLTPNPRFSLIRTLASSKNSTPKSVLHTLEPLSPPRIASNTPSPRRCRLRSHQPAPSLLLSPASTSLEPVTLTSSLSFSDCLFVINFFFYRIQ